MPGMQVTCECGRRLGTVSVRFTQDLNAAAAARRAALTAACPHCPKPAQAKPPEDKPRGK